MITELLLLYKDLRLVCKKIYRLVLYTPMKCFNNFVQSAVIARREREVNQNPNVVAETRKLLQTRSHGYQIMDRSRYAVMKFFSDENTHGAINRRKSLDSIDGQLYEVELVKSEYEHEGPKIFLHFSPYKMQK